MAETGAVAWMFERKGVITLPAEGKSEDEMMEIVLEAGAEDLQSEEGFFEIKTAVEDFEPVRKQIVSIGLTPDNASLQWVAKNEVAVSGEAAEKVMKLIDMLEDNDDVQNVYSNADFADE